MKPFQFSNLRLFTRFLSVFLMTGVCSFAEGEGTDVSRPGEEPEAVEETEVAATRAVAEVWPVNDAEDASPMGFEKWRSKLPPANGTTLALEELSIPERGTPSMVRVRGVLVPPRTGGYTVLIQGMDAAELWLADDATGEWKRVQRNGNPNTGTGRVKLELGVAKRFEFWTMGRGRVSVEWELVTREAAGTNRITLVKKQVIPGTVMEGPGEKPDDRLGSGLSDEWKRVSGLDPESVEGPHGPWGDADSDKLLNWQEQVAGTHPNMVDAEGRAGLVRWEVWRNIPGKYVFDLTRTPGFPQHPEEIRYLHRLELPVGNGKDYGSRMRGLLKAPASGEYEFMVIANDTAELWLGETESWKTKKLVARMEQHGGQLRWTRGADPKPLHREQVSSRVVLQKGKSYYLEVLHKQDSHEDHCSVAWVRPGAATAEVIGAEFLVSWKPNNEDADDDGLPDAWQQSAGLTGGSVDASNRGSHADADHDGRTNWDEWKVGSNPLQPEAVVTEHMLTLESLVDVPGDRIGDLVLDPRYPANPSHTTLVDNMDFRDEGNNYGCRLRGYLTAPDDGPHVFYLAGNDACILYLADSENEFSKKVIAQTTRGSGWRAFGQNPSQQSEPIELTKGQRYYIEVLYKRGAREEPVNKRDHSSVAWKRPGRLQTIIDAAYFSPYTGDTRDTDGDDLPDDWEVAHGLDSTDPTGANGFWGDPDNDWLDNFREFQLSFDPKESDYQPVAGLERWDLLENFREFQLPLDAEAGEIRSLPGFALWECYENIPGRFPALFDHPSFPGHPTQRKWVSSLEGPPQTGGSYGSRIRTFLVPPATGDYIFAISGDNEATLSLGVADNLYARERIAFVKEGTGYRKWDDEPGQISAPIRLEEGIRYFVEVLHKQATGADHVSVAWQIPGTIGFRIIRDRALAGFTPDSNDKNSNDLPDDWEKTRGFAFGFTNGYQDLDKDGLSNRQEYLARSDPRLADTDSDGIDDGTELNDLGSNPCVADVAPFVLMHTIEGRAVTATHGGWIVEGSGLVNRGVRGWIEYAFDVTAAGVYMIELQTRPWSAMPAPAGCQLVFSIDGTPVVRKELETSESDSSRIQFLTPWIREGRHIVRVFLDNAFSQRRVVFDSMKILAADGPDGDGNSVPDWVQKVVSARNELFDVPATSKVSPLCLEGRADWPGLASGVTLNPGPDSRWFADVPLRSDGTPTALHLSFENGGHHKQAEVRWRPTNLLEEHDHLIRQGDSLLLTATTARDGVGLSTERVAVVAQGERIEFSASEPHAYRFDVTGKVILDVTHTAGGTTKTVQVTVEVVGLPQGESPVFVPYFEREWEVKSVDENVVVEWDPRVRQCSQPKLAENGLSTRYHFTAAAPFDLQTLFRLGEGGSVLGSVPMRRLTLRDGDETGTAIVDKFENTYLVMMPVVLSEVYEDVTLSYSISAGGITYEDGTGPGKLLEPGDFSDLGQASVQFLKPANLGGSVCHRASLWQGKERIAFFP